MTTRLRIGTPFSVKGRNRCGKTGWSVDMGRRSSSPGLAQDGGGGPGLVRVRIAVDETRQVMPRRRIAAASQRERLGKYLGDPALVPGQHVQIELLPVVLQVRRFPVLVHLLPGQIVVAAQLR